MVGFWRVANRAKKKLQKRLDFMLAGSRLIVAVAILNDRITWHTTTARDDDKRLETEGMAAKPLLGPIKRRRCINCAPPPFQRKPRMGSVGSAAGCPAFLAASR